MPSDETHVKLINAALDDLKAVVKAAEHAGLTVRFEADLSFHNCCDLRRTRVVVSRTY